MLRTTSRTFRAIASAAVIVCVAAPLSHSATVAGNVVDSTTNLPLAGVEVLIDGVPSGVSTDLMGNFSTQVGEGERLFTFRRSGFSEQSVGPMPIAAEGEARLPGAKLAPNAADDILMLEELSVAGQLVKGSSGDLQNQRMKADVAIDFLSADQLAKFSAGDAAEAIIRIPGVSVANGQFAVIRGLSDRFLSTTLHGLKLPSPDPEKQAFQMDLLPSSAVGSIVVSKTYGPELWGESGGGNIDIATNAIPDENYIRFGAGLKINDNAMDGGPDYKSSGIRERLGYGADDRPAVDTYPRDWQYIPTQKSSLAPGTEFSLELGRQFDIRDNKLGWRFSAENESSTTSRTGIRQQSRAPANLSGNYFEDPVAYPLVPQHLENYSQSGTENLTSFNTTLAYQFAKTHQVKLDAIYVQNGIDTSYTSYTPFEVDSNLDLVLPFAFRQAGGDFFGDVFFQNNESYRERNLTTYQLSGDHEWATFHDLRFNWAMQHAETGQNESPFIETFYASPLSDPFASYVISKDAGNYPLLLSWLDNQETQDSARVDFVLPKNLFADRESELKFGAASERSERNVSGYTAFFVNSGTDIENKDAAGNIIGGPETLYPQLLDRSVPAFESPATSHAERELDAMYLGSSLALSSWLKVVGGARFESFSLTTSGGSRWGRLTTDSFYYRYYGEFLGTQNLDGLPIPNANGFLPSETDPTLPASSVNSSLDTEDVLPALGVIIEPSKTTAIRLAFSETRGRPSFREVSPFITKSIESGNLVLGNPALQPSSVKNYDLRLEWNPTAMDSYSLSFFYKEITDPIEKLLFDTDATASELTESWVNNPTTAEVKGVEFELKHNLGRWSEMLEEFSFNGNFTYIEAEVDENPIVIQRIRAGFNDESALPTTRRLYDQPEYILNADVTWRRERWGSSATFAAYAISDVLVAGGLSDVSSAPGVSLDLYQREYVRYDFIMSQRLNRHFKVKFSVKNLFDPVLGTIYDREATASVIERNSYRLGRTYSLSVTGEF